MQGVGSGLLAVEIFKWANLLFNNGAFTNPDRAIQEYNEAIRLKPDHTGAFINRGMVYGKIGNITATANDARKACSLGNFRLLEIPEIQRVDSLAKSLLIAFDFHKLPRGVSK